MKITLEDGPLIGEGFEVPDEKTFASTTVVLAFFASPRKVPNQDAIIFDIYCYANVDLDNWKLARQYQEQHPSPDGKCLKDGGLGVHAINPITDDLIALLDWEDVDEEVAPVEVTDDNDQAK